MPLPDPKKPGGAPAAPDEDEHEHGGKLARFFRDLERDEPGVEPAPQPD